MNISTLFDLKARGLEALAPCGHFLALRISFAFPMIEQNTLPGRWTQLYSSRGMVLADPVMNWLYANSGAVRWSEIDLPDPRGVLQQAAEYGLRYGVAVCHCEASGERSFGSFTRSDREFTDTEIEGLEAAVRFLHDSLVPPRNLTKAELEALAMVKNGLLMKEIANLLGVSEGAVKLRLKSVKTKLKARNSTHAASKASIYGLI